MLTCVAVSVILAGKSATTSARNVGVATPPDVGPANTVFAVCVESVKERAGVVVAVATDVVNNGERLPLEKLVTVPEPTPPPDAVRVFPVSVSPLPKFKQERMFPLAEK